MREMSGEVKPWDKLLKTVSDQKCDLAPWEPGFEGDVKGIGS